MASTLTTIMFASFFCSVLLDEEVMKLLYVKDHQQLCIEPNTVVKMERRYLFASSLPTPGESNMSPAFAAEGGGTKKADFESVLDEAIYANKGEIEEKESKDDTMEKQLKQEEFLERERKCRRLVILAGDFNTILKDLRLSCVAKQESIVEMRHLIKEGGIYLLTPSKRSDPIYLVLSLDHRDSKAIHMQLVRLALQMSRHLVVYFGESTLMAGECFGLPSSKALQAASAAEATVHCRKPTKATANQKRTGSDEKYHGDHYNWLVARSDVNVLTTLKATLCKYSLTSYLDTSHRTVRLNCVLDIAPTLVDHYEKQCNRYCEELFALTTNKSGKLANVTHRPLPPPVIDEPIRVTRLMEFVLPNVHNPDVKSNQKLKPGGGNKDPQFDPHVDPMWLHSVCGSMARVLFFFEEADSPQQIRSLDIRRDEDSARKSNAFDKTTRFIQFGILQRVLESWKGCVQMVTVLPNGDKESIQKFLDTMGGVSVAKDMSGQQKQEEAQDVQVMWRYSQALDMLHVFLVYNHSLECGNLPETQLSNLVFATTALSNVCVLPPRQDGQDTTATLQRCVNLLQGGIGKQVKPWDDKDLRCGKEFLSGTLLLCGKESDYVTTSGDGCPPTTNLEKYFPQIVFTDRKRFMFHAHELLSSQFKLKLYESGQTCLQSLKLISHAINRDRLYPLHISSFYEDEHCKIMQQINSLARYGIGPRHGARPSSTQLPGAETRELPFTVSVEKRYAESVSSADTFPGSTNDNDATGAKSSDPPVDDKMSYDTLVRTDLSVLQKETLEASMGFYIQKQKTWKECRKSLEQEHKEKLQHRIEKVHKYITSFVTRRYLQLVYQPNLREMCKLYTETMEESGNLCASPCDYSCHYICALPKGHPVDGKPPPGSKGIAPRKHDCLVCKFNSSNSNVHNCPYHCQWCEKDQSQTPCSKKAGHYLVGPDVPHKCEKPHRCERRCQLEGWSKGCQKQCKKLAYIGLASGEGSYHPHLCKPENQHQCGKPCYLCKQYDKEATCDRAHGHKETDHLCKIRHDCPSYCDSPGICERNTDEPVRNEPAKRQPEKVLRTKNGWKLACKEKLESFKTSHSGVHYCGKDSSHTCNRSCTWCRMCCDQPYTSDGNHLCTLVEGHGPVVNNWGKIVVQKRQKSSPQTIEELAKAAASEGSSGKPASCSEVCTKAGPRHIHKNPGQGKTGTNHSTFWREVMKFEDPSKASKDAIKLFDGCPKFCREAEHKLDKDGEVDEHLFCLELACHTGTSEPVDENGDFGYISKSVGHDSEGHRREPNHRFKCGISHKCKALCLFNHSRQQKAKGVLASVKAAAADAVEYTRAKFSSDKNMLHLCDLPIGHEEEKCCCAWGDMHTCGAECSAASCLEPCDGPLMSKYKPDHVHMCGIKNTCLAPCELFACKNGFAVATEQQHKDRCDLPCKRCNNRCKSANHYHCPDKDAGEYHVCDESHLHMCHESCQRGGWCKPGANTDTQYERCAVALGFKLTHDPPHRCTIPTVHHFCAGRTCSYKYRQQQCSEYCCLRKDKHQNNDHNCLSHYCLEPCKKGRCGKKVASQCTIKLDDDLKHTGREHWCGEKSTHYCTEVCKMCEEGHPVYNPMECTIGNWCMMESSHQGDVHYCSNHKCNKECSYRHSSGQVQLKCKTLLVYKDGNFDHDCKCDATDHLCKKQCDTERCNEFCQLDDGHSTCEKHVCQTGHKPRVQPSGEKDSSYSTASLQKNPQDASGKQHVQSTTLGTDPQQSPDPECAGQGGTQKPGNTAANQTSTGGPSAR